MRVRLVLTISSREWNYFTNNSNAILKNIATELYFLCIILPLRMVQVFSDLSIKKL